MDAYLETVVAGIFDHFDQHVIAGFIRAAFNQQLSVAAADIVFIHKGGFGGWNAIRQQFQT